MSGTKQADVLVIGAGAVGASIAFELSRRGASVIVLDAGPAVGNGCSYANAGLLAPSHVEPLATPANVAAGLQYTFAPNSPFYVRPTPRILPWLTRYVTSATPRRASALTARMRELATESLRLHGEYADAGLNTGYCQRGSLDVFLTEKQFERAVRSLGTQGDGSAHAEILSSTEARIFEPTLGEVAGAIHHPEDAQCGSQDFVRATLSAAEGHGARVVWGARVDKLLLNGKQVAAVESTNGRFTAGTYVLAAGLGSEQLCRSVGIRMPMTGAKGYVVDLETAGPTPKIPLSFTELKVVATPYVDRLRLCGTLELGSDPHTMDDGRLQAIRDAGQRGLPQLEVRSTLQTWAGQRPCTADGVPAIGRSAIRPNMVVAAGHGMWGLVLAPITGQMIARGVVEAAPTLYDTAFSPDRFGATIRPLFQRREIIPQPHEGTSTDSEEGQTV